MGKKQVAEAVSQAVKTPNQLDPNDPEDKKLLDELQAKQKKLFLEKGVDLGVPKALQRQWLEEATREKTDRSLDEMLDEFSPWAEGKRPYPYEDTVGKLTIGIGRNLTDRGLSEDEIQYLYANDKKIAIEGAETFDWFDGLNNVRKMVVVDMIFNMGLSRFRSFVMTIAAIEAGNFEAAAKQMMDSKWFRQTGRRAQRLVSMMASGMWS